MEKMRQITIRPAVEDDLEAFLKLGEAIGNPPGVWKNNSKSDFHDLQERMKEGEKIFLLAIIGHKIIGFVVIHLFRRLDPTGYDPKSCTVGVVVHPGYRKQGIGSQINTTRLERSKNKRNRNCLHLHRNREYRHAEACGKTGIYTIHNY